MAATTDFKSLFAALRPLLLAPFMGSVRLYVYYTTNWHNHLELFCLVSR